MKLRTITRWTLSIATALAASATSYAGEMEKVYELSESGTQIVFSSTKTDDSVPKPKPSNVNDRKTIRLKPSSVEEFEMAESGHVISFKSNSNQTWPKQGKLVEHQESAPPNLFGQVAEFEMAESGQKIKFN